MTNGTEKYIDTVKWLENLFDFLNEKLFDNELIKPVITIQRDERNKTNGWWSVKKVWKWQDVVPMNCAKCEKHSDDLCDMNFGDCVETKEFEEHELNITAQQLNRPALEIAEIMLHEMCHEYATMHNLQDCSRSGMYHNKLYRKIAETHGLNVEMVKTYGWANTFLTPTAKQLIGEFIKTHPDTIIYRLPVVKGQTKSSSTRKYVCPVCGQSVRATKEIRLICADCNEYMTEE